MKKTIGQIIRSARERKNMERETLAKRLGISVHYVRHMEYDRPLPFSDGLRDGIKRVLHVNIPRALADKHNRRTAMWWKKYRVQQAKKKQKAERTKKRTKTARTSKKRSSRAS